MKIYVNKKINKIFRLMNSMNRTFEIRTIATEIIEKHTDAKNLPHLFF